MMKTVITTSTDEAAHFIKRGGLVAFPTETVYGLGANVFDPKAVAAIFTAKRRPADNPLIAHIGHISQVTELASEVSETARKLMGRFFPGPLTVVLKKMPRVPSLATAGLDTIGIRMPRHALTRRFLQACETPVVAPSANISGKPSPTTWQAVLEDLDGRIDCILQGEATQIGLESTVVDCTSDPPVVLRSGAVTLEQLREVVPETGIYHHDGSEPARSPGLKHKHYSPRASVVLVDDAAAIESSPGAAFIGTTRPVTDLEKQKVCGSAEEYASSLFEFFRECDRAGIRTIYCETVDRSGIGAALMDRLERAAKS